MLSLPLAGLPVSNLINYQFPVLQPAARAKIAFFGLGF
jgi:hypothetical protein